MWNCAGLRAGATSTPAKFGFFDSQFPNANFSIAAFVETHHKDDGDFCQDLGQFQQTHNILHSPVSGETHSGLIILVSREYEIVEYTDSLPGRLFNAKLKKLNKTLNLSVFYGPQWGRMKKEEVSDVIDKFWPLHAPDETNIILGDFNFAEFDIDKGKGMGSRDHMIKPLWEGFLSASAMVDPFRVQCPSRRIFSFSSSQGKSRGDRVYTSENRISSIKNVRYVSTPFQTAHKMMTFDLQDDQEIGPGYWKMNSSILNDGGFKLEIEEVFRELEGLNLRDHVDWWDMFVMVVQGTTISYTRRKARIKYTLKNFLLSRVQALEEMGGLDGARSEEYSHYKRRLDELIHDEIRGHQVRTRGQPKYELNEPDISTYSKFEKRYQAGSMIHQLEDDNGQIRTDTGSLLDISEKYYTALFKKSGTNVVKQNKLLKNVLKKVSIADQRKLDAPLTLEEPRKTVMSLLSGKSPGPDGITAEFYKAFWYLIGERFLLYVNAARVAGFRDYRNRSSTTIIYKRKGEVYKLDYYRPIALINVDLKILTKTLSNRLRPVLPSIIHWSQTAVDGRRIDHTVHLIRDLVDLINRDDSDGALIFLDQEKAFDRVEHDFLFRTMAAFGIGEGFIGWLRVLYSNATTNVKINGHFTGPIPLTRGLRQGCPLSPSLYVLVVEIFALQLRLNLNIVGFTVGGERIVSMHYADDATIIIKQNQCFKEVIKEIQDYEEASGARVNVQKTKGLWLGRWKDREDAPLGLTWTNGNVKTLGVYFGNDDPAPATFADIVPKIKRSMDYWKQFRLSKFAKARVVEIFHASRLWYASTFYPIPEQVKKDLQSSFRDYINFPRHERPTVSEAEMKKLRLDGGIKLIDIQTKLETSRSMWLMDLLDNPSLQVHLAVVTSLVGTQKGGLQATDLVFTNVFYCNRLLDVPASRFYSQALKSTAKLTLCKKIRNLDEEKIFYNSMFTDVNGKTLAVPRRCERDGVFTYGAVAAEYTKQCLRLPCKRYVAAVFRRIAHFNIYGRSLNTVFISRIQGRVAFGAVTYKDVYEELLRQRYVDHHSLGKWDGRFSWGVDWARVWSSINNPITTECVRTTVWEQIHLNEYCTYSYNKWHGAQDRCPLCLVIPATRFHLTLECWMTQKLWRDLEPCLLQLSASPVTDHEKVFGMVGHTPCVLLRNWLTFILRHCIAEQESVAYHNGKGLANERDIKIKFNDRVKSEAMEKYLIYSNLGRTDYFEKIFTVNDFLVTWENDWYQVLTLFQL